MWGNYTKIWIVFYIGLYINILIISVTLRAYVLSFYRYKNQGSDSYVIYSLIYALW